ncbi:MAG TPA: hypothetical protein VHQ47_18465 [Phycisphaerae bacterium]|nr:hypothetical protein [Phycisphaerae bacterium]
MRSISLPDQIFDELQKLAQPPLDTPESLAARLIHQEALRRGAQSEPPPVQAGANALAGVTSIRSPRLAKGAPPDVLHKQVLELPPHVKL